MNPLNAASNFLFFVVVDSVSTLAVDSLGYRFSSVF
jgi:hypothetical protein